MPSGPANRHAVMPGRVEPIVRIAMGVLAAAGVSLMFAAAMTRAINYDEEQYIAAGVMARHLLPYRDFAYLQAPLYPFVLGLLFNLTGGYYTLSARLLTFGLSLVSAVLLWRVLRRLGASLPLATVLMAACLASPFLDPASSSARNDALPLALFLAGLWLHLSRSDGSRSDGSFWRRAAVALLFGLAVEAKVSYLFGPVAMGLHALLAPRVRLPAFMLGTLAAAVPIILCFATAPEAFRFGLLDYHLVAPVDWYAQQGLAATLRWPIRVRSLGQWLLEDGNATLIALAGAFCAVAMVRQRAWTSPSRLPLGLLVGAILLGLLPSPSWPMYYAAAAPLLACCIAHLERAIGRGAYPRILLFVVTLPALPMLIAKTAEVGHVLDPAKWVGLQAHRTAVDIRSALPRGGEVATLFPLAVLDANPVRREFATGPFVFRSGDLFTPERLASLHALSPGTLEAAFDRRPPAAIYAGLFAKRWSVPMDAALLHYAETHMWRLVRSGPEGGRLWLNRTFEP